jgi:hypothetical protein
MVLNHHMSVNTLADIISALAEHLLTPVPTNIPHRNLKRIVFSVVLLNSNNAVAVATLVRDKTWTAFLPK